MFVTLNRVYGTKGETGVKIQSITVDTSDISTARACNRLGFPEHRSTIVLKSSGISVDLADKISSVRTALGAPAALAI
jgi:hypothetical protein